MVRMNDRKKFAVVLCCNTAWLPMAAATFRFCQQQQVAEIADFYLIVHGITETDLETFEAFTDQHKITVDINVVDPSTALKQIEAGRFSTATLLRLMLDSIIPKNYQRLLYIDCDVLVLAPLKELFEINLNDKPIAAVEDYVSLSGLMNLFSDHPRKIGMRPESRYFNAGVILFDWPMTLQEGYLRKATEIIVQAQNTNRNLPFLDQDVLNLSFESNWQALPSRYNLMTFMLGYNKDKPVLRHFNSRNKPWGKTWIPHISDYKKFYTEVFANTAYVSIVENHFTIFSMQEIFEYLLRKFALSTKLRRVNSKSI